MTEPTRHVLFVDDDPDILELVENLLAARGIEVSSAADGEEALALLDAGLMPDIILADVVMPNIDGFDLFRTVRSNSAWADIPFVLVTANDDRANLSRALALGSDDYLIKPFDPERLIMTVYGKMRREDDTAHRVRVETHPKSNGTNGHRHRSAAPHALLIPEGHDAPTLPRRPVASVRPMRGSSGQPAPDLSNELKTYLRVLWRYKGVILICTVAATLAAIVLSAIMTPLYEATAVVRVSVAAGGVVDWGANALAGRMVNTYVELATSSQLLGRVVQELDLDHEPGLTVEPVPETELLHVVASDPDPEVAAQVANRLGALMVENSLTLYGGDAPTARQLLEEQMTQAQADLDAAIAEYDQALRSLQVTNTDTQGTPVPQGYLDYLQQQMDLRQQMYADLLSRYESARVSEVLRANAITLVEEAYVPTSPASPKKALNLMLGLVGGLGVGVLLALLLEAFDTTIRSTEDLQARTILPLLAQIPETPRGLPFQPAPGVLFATNGYPSTGDAYHRLRAHLLMSAAIPSSGASLLVTSPEPGTGKSTVAANLALALAQSGSRVILADMDLRRPNQHTIFKLPGQPGLSDVLRGETTLHEVLQDSAYPNLRVLTAGRVTEDLSGLATSAQLGGLLELLQEDCDYVVADAPAVLATADTTMLAARVNALLLVVAQRRTDRSRLRQAIQHLAQVGARVTGVVLNRVPGSGLYVYYARGGPATPVEALQEQVRRIRTGGTATVEALRAQIRRIRSGAR